mmetsp:Transcript_18352/g.46006  ORF Transcript_18352/g.46006 Transcript_18352/m.46006 type:complete len:98 (+) Transcript_18352:1575-1868(+)
MERRGEKSLQECLRLEVYCLCWGVIRFTVFVCTYVNSLTRPSLCCPAPYISKEHEDENKGYFGPGPGQYEVTGQKYQQLSKPMNGGMRWGMEPRFGL